MKFSLVAALALASVAAADFAVGDSVVLLCKINFIRIKNNLAPLGLSEKLVASTKAHSADQAKMGQVTIIGSDGSSISERARRAGFNYNWIGELVGGGYRNEDELLADFMTDERMRRHILRKEAELFGSGFARDREDYPYWTLDFGRDYFGRVNVPDCKNVAPFPKDFERAFDEDVVLKKSASPIVTRE